MGFLDENEDDESLGQQDQDFLNTIAPPENDEKVVSSVNLQPEIESEADTALEDIANEQQARAVTGFQDHNDHEQELEQQLKMSVDSAPTVQAMPGMGPSVHEQYANMFSEYKKLQDQRRRKSGIATMLDGLSGIAQAIAGKNAPGFKPTYNAELIEKMSNRPVQDFEEGVKQKGLNQSLLDQEQMRSKESPVSQFYREMATKRGFDPAVVKDKSAWDLSQMAKVLGKPSEGGRIFQQAKVRNPITGITEIKLVNMATGEVQENNIGAAGFAAQVRIDPRTSEVMAVDPGSGKQSGTLTAPTPQSPEQASLAIPEINMENLTAKQQTNLKDARKEFLDDTKDERASLQASRSIKELLASGKALDGDIMRAVQNKFSIATGNKGATSENDVTPFGGRQAILDRISRQMNFWIKGQFTEDDRKFLSGLAGIMERSSQRELDNSTKFFANNLHKDLKSAPNMQGAKIKPESVKQLLGADVYSPDHGKVEVIDVKTGKRGLISEDRVEAAIASGKFKKANP